MKGSSSIVLAMCIVVLAAARAEAAATTNGSAVIAIVETDLVLNELMASMTNDTDNNATVAALDGKDFLAEYKQILQFISVQLGQEIKLKLFQGFATMFRKFNWPVADGLGFKVLLTAIFIVCDLLSVFVLVFVTTSIMSRVRKLANIAYGPLHKNVRRNVETLLL